MGHPALAHGVRLFLSSAIGPAASFAFGYYARMARSGSSFFETFIAAVFRRESYLCCTPARWVIMQKWKFSSRWWQIFFQGSAFSNYMPSWFFIILVEVYYSRVKNFRNNNTNYFALIRDGKLVESNNLHGTFSDKNESPRNLMKFQCSIKTKMKKFNENPCSS